MPKVNFNTFSSLANQSSFLNRLNQNFSNLSNYLDNTLSRNGQLPNTMEATLNMDNRRITNLPKPVNSSEPVRKQDLDELYIDLGSIDEIRQDLINETSNRIAGDTALASIIGAAEGPIYNYDFDTVTAVQFATIAGSQNAIRTAGYSSAGDGGGALYKRVVSEPAHALKIQSLDGAWWEIAERRVYVEMAGAKGDFNPQTQTGTDDTVAINKVFDWARTRMVDGLSTWFNGLPNFGIAFRDGAIYKTTSSINSTGLRCEGLTIWGNAACIYPLFTASKPVVDGFYSKGLWVDKLFIFADDPDLTGTTAPSYGFTIGRIDDADVSGCSFNHCQFRGYFTNACFLNVSGEIQYHEHCTYHNFMPTVIDEGGYTETGLSVRISDYDVSTFTSEFAIPDPMYPRTQWFGINANYYLHCHLQSDWGIPLHISNLTANFTFEDLYTYSHYGVCNILLDDGSSHFDLRIAGHQENGPGVLATIMFNTNLNDCNMFNFTYFETGPNAPSVFGVLDSTAPDFKINMFNSDVRIGPPHPAQPTAMIASTEDVKWLNFHGDFRLSTYTEELHDFSAFSSFKGTIYTVLDTADFSNIPSGYMEVFSAAKSDIVKIVTP